MFYKYFAVAKKYCPSKLKPFAPAIYYEVARQMVSHGIMLGELEKIPNIQKFMNYFYGSSYDRIVERIGEEIVYGKNHIR